MTSKADEKLLDSMWRDEANSPAVRVAIWHAMSELHLLRAAFNPPANSGTMTSAAVLDDSHDHRLRGEILGAIAEIKELRREMDSGLDEGGVA